MTNGTTAPRASPTTPAARQHGGQAFDRRVARAVNNGCRFSLIRRRADDERSHNRDRSRSELRGQHRLTPATTTPRSAPSAAVMEGRAEHERHASALGAPGRDWPGAQLDQSPGQASRYNWLSSSGASTATAISGDQAPRPIRVDQLSPRKVCSDHADGAGSHKATTAARASAAVAEPPRSVSPAVGQTDRSKHGAETQRSPLLRKDRPAAESDNLHTPPTTPTGGQHTLRTPAAARTQFSQALHQASRQRRTGCLSPTRLLRGMDHAATSDEPPSESVALLLLRSPQTPRSAGRVRHFTDPIRGNFDPPIAAATSSLPDLSAVDDDLFADLIFTHMPPTRQAVRSGNIITRLR